MYIILYFILSFLCITGLAEATKYIAMRFLNIKSNNGILVIPTDNYTDENTEFMLRSCISKIRWMGKSRPERVIILSSKGSIYKEKVCTLIKREYEYPEIMSPHEFIREFSSAKEVFISNLE